MTPWTLLIDPLSRLLDKIIPDETARDKAKLELLKAEREQDFEQLKMAFQADQAQIAVNAEEAKSSNLFVAGWRPFIGWVCGVAFAYHFIAQPLLAFLLVNLPPEIGVGKNLVLPTFDMNNLYTVLGGILGLGSLRTVEKIKGVGK